MRPLLAAALLAVSTTAAPAVAQPAGAAAAALAERVLRDHPLVDGHNDLPWAIREHNARPLDIVAYDLRSRTPGATDLARLKAGHVGAQFWSVYIPGEPDDPAYASNGTVTGTPGYARVQLEQIDVARRVIARYPDRLAFATRAADVAPAFAAGKVASFLGMEGGHAIENSLGALRTYYDQGVRYMTLTHNVTLDWADAALDAPRHGGLTRFGEEVVREMNRLGMLVDLSHVSDGTMSAALRVSEAPVIFSHSSARALCNHRRNVPDSILAKLPHNGGVVMVTFVNSFVSQAVKDRDDARAAERARLRARGGSTDAVRAGLAAWDAAHPAVHATVAQVADHVEHVRRVAGVDHVGIGGDFDGTTPADLPTGLEDVSKYPALFTELARRGWTEDDLAKLAGGNVLRVLGDAERVAARLQRERPASTATIQQLDGGARP
ncbi:dipeptidase [Gemmatimonadetes bacterium T265]|nr:dipeptidase [Gemmatimonadetes bacterium T265]